MDQAILRSMTYKHKYQFMKRLLNVCNRGQGIQAVTNEFNVKDATWSVVSAWKEITLGTLKTAWHNLWSATMFDEYNVQAISMFSIFRKRRMMSELLDYATGMSCDAAQTTDEANIEEIMIVKNNGPVVHSLFLIVAKEVKLLCCSVG